MASIDDLYINGELNKTEEDIRVDAIRLKKMNPSVDYLDLCQAGWVGALRSIAKHGKPWPHLTRRAAYGEMLRHISKSCNCRCPKFTETVMMDRSIVRNSDAMLEVSADDRIDEFSGWRGRLGDEIALLGEAQGLAIEVYFENEPTDDSIKQAFGSLERGSQSKFRAVESLRKRLSTKP